MWKINRMTMRRMNVKESILTRLLSLCLLVCSFFSTLATAQEAEIKSLEQLQATLSSQNIVRGHFEQIREVAMFDQPLSSQGSFVLDKDNGLVWDQTTPFPVKLILTDNKLSQRFADQPAQIITDQDNPMAFYFSHIFLAVFHGNTEQLKEQFSLAFTPMSNSGGGNLWKLELTPKNAPLNAVFRRISLSGSQDIQSIALEEIRGDSTTIHFSQLTHQPPRLTDAEAQQFKF